MQHGRFVFRVEADRRGLGAAAQRSAGRLPSLIVHYDERAGLEPLFRLSVVFDRLVKPLRLELFFLGSYGTIAQLRQR